MQDISCKLSRIAAVVVILLAACVGSAWASGVPWQVGDVVVCYGTGSCNVIRIVGGTPTVLDSLSDAGFLGGTGTPGFTYGAAIDDALHLLVTDGGSGTQSNIVKYSIASRNWLNNPSTSVAHTIIATFDGSVGGSGSGIRAVALDSAGHLFVGNSNPATIAEIDQNRPAGNGTASFPSGWRAFTQYPLNFIIIDSNKFLQQVTTAGTSGSTQPSFSQTPQTGTTTDGTVTWTNIGSSTTPLGSFAVSSAVVPPTQWANGTCYGDTTDCKPSGSNVTTVFDTNGHLQQVSTAGTSGATHPTWNDAKGTTRDNAVIWTDQGQKKWGVTYGAAPTTYSLGNIVIDPAFHVQQVTTAGLSGATQPSWNDSSPPNFGITTTDGLKWVNQGVFAWAANTSYTPPSSPLDHNGIVVDSAGHIQNVTQLGGVSGPGPAGPTFNDGQNATTTDGLEWANTGGPSCPVAGECNAWQPTTRYCFDTTQCVSPYIVDINTDQVWVVTAPTAGATPGGKSGATSPTFSVGGIPVSGPLVDNAVVWSDQGGWTPNASYSFPQTVGDSNSNLWQVSVGGKSAGTAPQFTMHDSFGTPVFENNAVIWTDLGNWQPNTVYAQKSQVGDLSLHLQKVVGAMDGGTSGPGPNPPFTGSTPTIDGLQWQDKGLPVFGANCISNQLAGMDLGSGALNPAVYFTSGGGLVAGVAQDAVVQQVTTPLSTGTCTIIANFGPNVTLSAIKVVPKGATSLNPNADAVLVLAQGTVDLDANVSNLDGDEPPAQEDSSDVCNPTGPPTATATDSCAILISTTDGSTLATYVAASPSNLQALALNPLITDCTGTGGTACATSVPAGAAKVSSFLAGDGTSNTIYQFNFGSTIGSINNPAASFPTTPPAGCTGTCTVQGMVVYAGEGANQVGLAALNSGTLQSGSNTLTASFLSNSVTTSLYGSNSSPTTISPANVSLYASPVDESTCFNDGIYNSGNNTYSNNGLPCRQTTALGSGPGIAWKIDIPTGVTPAALPTNEILANSFKSSVLNTIDFSTDVFVDMAFDTSVVVGNTDPTGKYTSVHSLHEVPFSVAGGGGCSNTSPVPRQCFQSPNTIPFKFACTNFPKSSQGTLSPVLAIKQIQNNQAGFPINLFGTNGTNNYRFTGGQWVFNWNVDGFSGSFNACTFDQSGQVKTFCVPFTVAKSCK